MPRKCAVAGCWHEARKSLMWNCKTGWQARVEFCEPCHAEIEAAIKENRVSSAYATGPRAAVLEVDHETV